MPTNDDIADGSEWHYDLEERTALFGERVIRFLKQVPKNDINSPLVRQSVRSSTSVAPTMRKLMKRARRRNFRHRISISKREAKETMYRLRMIAAAAPEHAPQSRELWKEARELNKKFAAIHRNSSD